MDMVDFLSQEGFECSRLPMPTKPLPSWKPMTRSRSCSRDVDMPGSMDGLKLSAAVRDRWPPVRIVVTSGHRAVALTDPGRQPVLCQTVRSRCHSCITAWPFPGVAEMTDQFAQIAFEAVAVIDRGGQGLPSMWRRGRLSPTHTLLTLGVAQ